MAKTNEIVTASGLNPGFIREMFEQPGFFLFTSTKRAGFTTCAFCTVVHGPAQSHGGMSYTVHSSLTFGPLWGTDKLDVRRVLEWNVVAHQRVLARAVGAVLAQTFPRTAVVDGHLQWNILLRCRVQQGVWALHVVAQPRKTGLAEYSFRLPETLALVRPQTHANVVVALKDDILKADVFEHGHRHRVPAAALDRLRYVCLCMFCMQHLTQWKMLLMVAQGRRWQRAVPRRPTLPAELWFLVYDMIGARGDWWPTSRPV
jgi:hypothetical protein